MIATREFVDAVCLDTYQRAIPLVNYQLTEETWRELVTAVLESAGMDIEEKGPPLDKHGLRLIPTRTSQTELRGLQMTVGYLEEHVQFLMEEYGQRALKQDPKE